MNDYQILLSMAEQCEFQALLYTGDKNLETFYRNAAEGFRIKARNLPVGQVTGGNSGR